MNQCEDIDFRKTWAGLFYAEENWEGLGSAKILTSFPCSFFPRPLLQWLGAHLCRRTGRMKLFCLFSVPCTKTSAPRSWQERKRKEGEGLRVLVLLLIKICWQPTDPFLSKFSCATHYHPLPQPPCFERICGLKICTSGAVLQFSFWEYVGYWTVTAVCGEPADCVYPWRGFLVHVWKATPC